MRTVGRLKFETLHVIASEAKQSIAPNKGRVDCFASLAMTVTGSRPQNREKSLRRPRNRLAIQSVRRFRSFISKH
jgi:hypothetical protein